MGSLAEQKFSMFEYDFDSAEEERYQAALRALSGLAPGRNKTKTNGRGRKSYESENDMTRRIIRERREANRQEC